MVQEITKYQFKSINGKQHVIGYIDGKCVTVGPVMFNGPSGILCYDGFISSSYVLKDPHPDRVLPFEDKRPK